MNRFEKFEPGKALQPYVRHFVISEAYADGSYKMLPDSALVMGFQYKGHSSGEKLRPLSRYGATGSNDEYRVFKSNNKTGSVLVYFNDKGISHFFKNPSNELFSESLAMDNFVCHSQLNQVHEKLCEAQNDIQRIVIVENFLLTMLKYTNTDPLVQNALRLIHISKGDIKIKQLAELLNTSQSPLEKRFRNIVGVTPKKFASVVRFQSIASEFTAFESITDADYDANNYDQAIFIKEFNQFSGMA